MAKKPEYTKAQIVALQSQALKLYRADESHAKELGKAFLKVRAAMKHGDFKKWFVKHGLSQHRVSYCMDLAKGTFTKRKEKKISPERVRAAKAVAFVGHKLNTLFKSCNTANDHLTMISIHEKLRDALGATIAQAATLAGWKLDTPEVTEAADQLNAAIAKLIATVARPEKPAAAAATASV